MRILSAIVASIAIHIVVAIALGAYIDCASESGVAATLDLSSVELSFSEEESEVAPAIRQDSAPLPESLHPQPSEDPLPSEKIMVAPPTADEMKFPEPKEDALRMSTPAASIPEVANAPAPRQARIDAPPKPRRAIRPDYPKGARQRGEQGDVILEISVNRDGTVDDVNVVSSCGFRELEESAVKAAKAARFTPAMSGLKSVSSKARIKLSFKLK